MEQEDEVFVTIDDIIEDIRASLVDSDNVVGLTAEQIAQKLGFGAKKTAKLLRKQVQSGKLKVTKIRIRDVTGRANFTYVYHP